MKSLFLGSLFFSNDKTANVVLFSLIALIVLVPLCNAIFPSASALHFSAYTVSLLGKYLTFALLGLSLDLVWGYCGILALGHGAFFRIGRLFDGDVFDAPNW